MSQDLVTSRPAASPHFAATMGWVAATSGSFALGAAAGRKPFARAWVWIVFPALTATYLGQAAVVARDPTLPETRSSPRCPAGRCGPLSSWHPGHDHRLLGSHLRGLQGCPSGGRAGLLPSLRTLHTSTRHAGQIYVPAVNAMLAVAVPAVVLTFGNSESLASAHGVAVTTTIAVTTVLYLDLPWRQSHRVTGPLVCGVLALLVVTCFLTANAPRVLTRG